MQQAVDRVLARRVRLSEERSRWPQIVGSGLLHGLLTFAVVVAPILVANQREYPRYVSVTVVPVQALGVENPAPAEPRRSAETNAGQPSAQLEAEVESPPAMTMPSAKEPDRTERSPEPAPRPTAPTPSPSRQRPADSPPSPTPDPGGVPGARFGAPEGLPEGTSPFGAAVAGLDNPDFTYGYYVDQMLAMIRSRWIRPPLGDDAEAMIHFRIHTDGTVSEVRIVSSSGYNQFDLAGLRAVQAAAPFPPLPRSYRRDSLGVNLIFR